MGSLLVLSLTTLTPLMPWRTRLAKWANMAMGHILVLVILAAGPMIIIDQSQGEFTASAMLAILCLALPSAAFVCSCLLVYDCLLRYVFPCDVSFCHRKEAAGSLARFLKILLQQKASMRGFLNSEALQHLDELSRKCHVDAIR